VAGILWAAIPIIDTHVRGPRYYPELPQAAVAEAPNADYLATMRTDLATLRQELALAQGNLTDLRIELAFTQGDLKAERAMRAQLVEQQKEDREWTQHLGRVLSGQGGGVWLQCQTGAAPQVTGMK